MAESWAMCDAIATNLPVQVAMGILLKSLLGISPPQGGVASGSDEADDAERDEAILRRFGG